MLPSRFCLLALLFLLPTDTTASKDHPLEGPLEPFLGETAFESQVLFEGNGDERVREPFLAITVDGTLLATRTEAGRMRRSVDGGETWGEVLEAPFVHSDSNFVVDEKTGDILIVRMRDRAPTLRWSRDGPELQPRAASSSFTRAGRTVATPRCGSHASTFRGFWRGKRPAMVQSLRAASWNREKGRVPSLKRVFANHRHTGFSIAPDSYSRYSRLPIRRWGTASKTS